ncbi:Hypothetical predicted protein [Olea europaea subsp. europaea]|uniref:Uncharacterized protein n=1 Tax=Olea europaea subsp. europaea TaxID=158383 RepID=A0A8S0UL00_OLEEU|nr:Hypothetical predicted protein [Olea europaea subsp. europaea]
MRVVHGARHLRPARKQRRARQWRQTSQAHHPVIASRPSAGGGLDLRLLLQRSRVTPLARGTWCSWRDPPRRRSSPPLTGMPCAVQPPGGGSLRVVAVPDGRVPNVGLPSAGNKTPTAPSCRGPGVNRRVHGGALCSAHHLPTRDTSD